MALHTGMLFQFGDSCVYFHIGLVSFEIPRLVEIYTAVMQIYHFCMQAELASTRHQLVASKESQKASLKQARRESSTQRYESTVYSPCV